jgi:hypothetical protein
METIRQKVKFVCGLSYNPHSLITFRFDRF